MSGVRPPHWPRMSLTHTHTHAAPTHTNTLNGNRRRGSVRVQRSVRRITGARRHSWESAADACDLAAGMCGLSVTELWPVRHRAVARPSPSSGPSVTEQWPVPPPLRWACRWSPPLPLLLSLPLRLLRG